MNDSKESPEDPPPRFELLSPGPLANFHGSLVVNHLDNVPKATIIPQDKGKAAAWIAYFSDGWDDIGIWKSAFVEMFASTLLCYLSGLIDTTIANFGTAQAAAYAGVTNIFLLTLFIMAIAPGSGGRLEPLDCSQLKG
ncbi:hypothetical protein MMC28_006026 [Mycoblastus sanguinarius]|nr:hypothetical protein [Mycoblastus sanguinarius]